VRSFQPSLNRDGGRHELPHIYDDILKTHTRPPSDPRPLNPNSPSNPRTLRGLRPRGRPPGTHNRQRILNFLAKRKTNPGNKPTPVASQPLQRGIPPGQKAQAHTQPALTGNNTPQMWPIFQARITVPQASSESGPRTTAASQPQPRSSPREDPCKTPMMTRSQARANKGLETPISITSPNS
jgi:hypothetical protein